MFTRRPVGAPAAKNHRIRGSLFHQAPSFREILLADASFCPSKVKFSPSTNDSQRLGTEPTLAHDARPGLREGKKLRGTTRP